MRRSPSSDVPYSFFNTERSFNVCLFIHPLGRTQKRGDDDKGYAWRDAAVTCYISVNLQMVIATALLHCLTSSWEC